MRDELSGALRKALDLAEATVDATHDLRAALADPGRGRGGRPGVEAVADDLDADWRAIGTSWRAIGIRLRAHEDTLAFADVDGAALEVRAGAGAEQAVARRGETVFVRAFGEGGVAVLRAGGEGYVVDRAAGRLIEVRLPGPILGLPGDLAAPVDSWCAHADPWLAALVRERASSGRPWHVATAAGMLLRLADPGPDAFASLLAGRGDPLGDAIDAWARTLTRAQRADLDELGRIRVETLRDELDRLRAAADPDDAAWRRDLARWLRTRDDLACVVRVRRAGGDAAALVEAVSGLDAKAAPWVSALVDVRPLRDARLARVRRCDPEAWWAGEVEATP